MIQGSGATMLGLNPGVRGDPHPLHSMLPGFPVMGTPGGLMSTPGGPGSPRLSLPPPTPTPNMWPFIWSQITNLLPQLSIVRADPLSQAFSLKWNNHRSNMINVFERLLSTEAFCDVTIACEGGSIKCHKIVLSASSVYFEKLFLDNTCDHPIVFLKDVKEHQMRAIIEYMYRGDVNVSQEELPSLLRVAELLRVKGMQEERRHGGPNDKEPTSGGHNGPMSYSSKPPSTPEPSSTPRTTENNSPTPTSSPRTSERQPSSGGVPSQGRRTPVSAPPPHLPPHSLPHPPPGSGLPPNFRPFLTPPGGGPQGTTAPFPMWPLPGLFPGHPGLFNHREDMKPLSPVTKDRSKLSSGSSSDKEMMPALMPRDHGAGNPHLDEKSNYDRHNGNGDPHGGDPYEKSPKMPAYGGKLVDDGSAGGIAGYVPAQRLEWKRYKQYTRSDIMAAIEEVKKGKSALQVSKKFNIPSRTLYDKVKKMGITTGRQQQRKSMGNSFNAYTAAFPGMNMMSPLSRLDAMNLDNPYKDLMERMREARDEEDRDSRESEGLPPTSAATIGVGHPPPPHPHHPPFSILSPQMLNMMDRMKAELPPRPHSVGGADERGGRGSGDGGDTSPMNLSSERDEKPRVSEGSIPQSPSPGSTELTSPSNPHTSPSGGAGEYYRPASGDRRSIAGSPPPIDIRAQFLADLRRLGDHHNPHHHPLASHHLSNLHHRPSSPIGVADESSSSPEDGSTTPNNGHDLSSKSPMADSLPPRKRRLSGSLTDGGKLSAPGLNGLHGLHKDDTQPPAPTATQVN